MTEKNESFLDREMREQEEDWHYEQIAIREEEEQKAIDAEKERKAKLTPEERALERKAEIDAYITFAKFIFHFAVFYFFGYLAVQHFKIKSGNIIVLMGLGGMLLSFIFVGLSLRLKTKAFIFFVLIFLAIVSDKIILIKNNFI